MFGFGTKKLKQQIAELEEQNAGLTELAQSLEIENKRLIHTNGHLAQVLNKNGNLTRQNEALARWTEELELEFLNRDWELPKNNTTTRVVKVRKS